MSYSGYLYYTSQEKLAENRSSANSRKVSMMDPEAGCRNCRALLWTGTGLKQEKRHIRMGVPYAMIVISLIQVSWCFSAVNSKWHLSILNQFSNILPNKNRLKV